MNETYTYKVAPVGENAERTFTCDLYTVNHETFELEFFTCKVFRGNRAANDADSYGKVFCKRINK